MQLSAQIVLAAIAAGSALSAPLPEPLKFKMNPADRFQNFKGLNDHLPKINGGLALTAGALGIGAGVATAQNNAGSSEPAAAPAPAPQPAARDPLGRTNSFPGAGPAAKINPASTSLNLPSPKPPTLDSFKDKKNGAFNGGLGTIGGLAGVGGASYGLYNALNPADPAPAPAPAPAARDLFGAEDFQRRLNPAMALGGLMMTGGPSIQTGNVDMTQQTWQKGPKTSGATSRRDIDDDADLLNRRLLSFGNTQQSQTAQGGADGGKASGAASGTRGSLFAGGDNGSGLFGQPMMAPAAAAKRLFEEPAARDVVVEEPSLQRRLMFGIDTQNQDVTQQQWLVGGKTSGATS